MIKVNNLHKYYNKGKNSEQHVLNNINLEFGNTGLVCILGESGSGKTTLLNTIGGLDDFTSGTLKINDVTLTGYKSKLVEPIRNDHYGYIFQNYYLLKDYSVSYNVKIALNRYDLTEKEKNERTDYILNLLNISKFKNKPVSKLSGGQQQRVSIARALVKAPDIILADEPTGNLDEENTIRTMTILKSISTECLVLLVTHERRIANFFADRIIEISDGKVVRDENNISSSYERSDDSNIYLKELQLEKFENEYAKFNIFHKNHETPANINLNMVWKDGKLYIQNLMDYDILFESEENGIQILDKERPTLKMDEIDNFSYDLSPLSSKGNAKLPFSEIWRIALSNLQIMCKKHISIWIILLSAAVLLSITTAKAVNMFSINEEKIVSTDSHYVKINFENVSVFRKSDQEKILDFTWKYLDKSEYGDTFFTPDINLYLMGEGFEQVKNLKQIIGNYSFVSKEHLNKDNLIYGTMPEKRNQIVVDIQVINNLMESNGVVSSDHKKVESFVGSLFRTAKASLKLEITGISDNNEPAIYCGQNILLNFPQKSYNIASIDELKRESPDDFSDIELSDNEILLREGIVKSNFLEENGSYVIGDDYKHEYKIVGTIPNKLGIDYILTDNGCDNIRDLMIYENRTCMIYTNNKQSTIDYLKKLKADELNTNTFKINLTIPHNEEINKYRDANSSDTDASSLITIVVVFISIIMVYFTIKSNAMSRSEELIVYSLLGISKSSILKTYIIEMILLTSYTSLPAVVITSGVIKFIGSIPSLEIGMLFPWWSVLLLLAIIYSIHIIISILPVYNILSKPPATLAVKG